MAPRLVVVLAILTAWLLPAARAEKPTQATVAHIRLTGSLDEGPVSSESLFGSPAEKFKTKLDRIKKARNDANVKALYLELDGLSIGQGKVEELRRAIADFRKSGKKAFAYLQAGEGKDYLVALACDEIVLPESGWLMLTGMRMEVVFLKDLLDLLGIKADMLQMGEFKGAAEPLTRSSMSKEFREQLTLVLDDYFEHNYLEAIASGRAGKKLTPAAVRQLVDHAPFSARRAREEGLIDRVAYANDLEDSFKTVLNADKVEIARDYAREKGEEFDLSNPFDLLKLLKPSKEKSSKKPKVAVVYAVGEIVTGKGGETFLGGDLVGSTTLVEAIRQADQDKTVKAIVLRVDSPGGSALASDLIWNELNRCKKPVIASMGDTAASGGYYISAAARKIYAEPGTLTGSIGVVGGKIAMKGLEDKVGIKTEVIARGANSGIFSTETPFTASEREAMTALMRTTYDQFLNKTLAGREKAGRKMTRADLEKLAGGRVWTGRQAKEHGLVDELGTLEDAIAGARKAAGVMPNEDLDLLILPKPRTFLDMLMDRGADSKAPAMKGVVQPLLQTVPGLAEKLTSVEGLLRLHGEPVWAIVPARVIVR